jgi:Uma2 family endonuclease
MSTAAQLKPRFTFHDYCQWDDDQRWELIGGEAFAMSPSPIITHQRVSMRLSVILSAFFAGKPCEPFAAPTDVKLSDQDVVQPDLLVVCNRDQVKDGHIEGPPSLVIEILSPSTLRHDRIRKLALYAEFGVKEYWLVQLDSPMVEVLELDGDAYRVAGNFDDTDVLQSATFPELQVSLSEVFADDWG